ncbi:MAG: hypothetical protein L6R42_005048 [Xanthoria sp. 1 TBL-2021]|nr:MAG: hypothetical protein L6R42_005048 [Xanthoria sp. 1 TBL-2021]
MVFKPLTELLRGPIVTIKVGPDRKSYTLHRDLLCDRSSYFRAALLGQFKEAQTGLIEFPDEEETTFELFALWLYTQLPQPTTCEELQRLITLMRFARSRLLDELHNDCMTLVRAYFRTKGSVAIREISMAYDTTPELPELRLFVCLEAVLQLRCRTLKELMACTDGELFQLVERDGNFASDFTKLLLLYSQAQALMPGLSTAAGATMGTPYDGLYHSHDTSDSDRDADKEIEDRTVALIVGATRYLARKQTSNTSK